MADSTVSKFLRRLRSEKCSKIITKLENLIEAKEKRELTLKEREDRFSLWGDLQDEVS
jgi:hypothetical protein